MTDVVSRVPTHSRPLTTVYAPATAVNIRQTLGPLGRGPADPTTQWAADGLWRAFRTPEGTATLHLRHTTHGVEASAWGAGAEWCIARVPRLLGRDDDWSELDVRAHPLLRDARHRNPGLRLTATGLVLDALIPAIIEQRVTSLEAFRGWAQLIRRYGEPAPGPAPERLRVPPSPETWRLIPSWVWHRADIDPRRSRAVISAAMVAPGLERTTTTSLTSAQVELRLRSVPGVGAWTAAETMTRSHGDADAVSVGDYHLAHWVGEALIGRRVDDDGMLELLAPWTGHRQRVIRLILASGMRFERRGPRMTLDSHRDR